MGILHGLTAALVSACLAAMLPVTARAQGCAADRVDIRGGFGSVRFKVELARTPAEQARGLMFREEMPPLSGMLFVYPHEADVSFWMRNTLIPLDMIFIDDEGRILRVHENAVPGDETPIPAGAPALAVLEINGGAARRFGLEAGDELRSPALPQDGAAWPCDPGKDGSD